MKIYKFQNTKFNLKNRLPYPHFVKLMLRKRVYHRLFWKRKSISNNYYIYNTYNFRKLVWKNKI